MTAKRTRRSFLSPTDISGAGTRNYETDRKKINMKRYRNYYHVTPEKSFSHCPISSFYKNTFLPLQKWISFSVYRHSLYSPDCSLQVCWWLAVMYWCESEKRGVSKRGFIFWSGHPYVEIGGLLWMSSPSDQLMRVYIWQKFLRQGLWSLFCISQCDAEYGLWISWVLADPPRPRRDCGCCHVWGWTAGEPPLQVPW